MSLPRLLNLDRQWGRLLFAAVVAVVAIVWLAYLPRLAQEAEFIEAQTRLESQGIDPGAFFYTDHPRALTE